MCLGLFQKKNHMGRGLEDNFFLKKPLGLLGFLLYPSGNSRQKASTLESPQNCAKPLGNFFFFFYGHSKLMYYKDLVSMRYN